MMYTNPISRQSDVTILDPFMGIGSTAYTCLGGPTSQGHVVNEARNVIGFELKESYYAQAIANCEKAKQRALHREKSDRPLMFAGMESEE